MGGGGVLAGCMADGLADAGASVAIFDFHKENGEARAAAIRGTGVKAIAIQGDASKREDLERALKTTLAELGGVDILINAAGVDSADAVLRNHGSRVAADYRH